MLSKVPGNHHHETDNRDSDAAGRVVDVACNHHLSVVLWLPADRDANLVAGRNLCLQRRYDAPGIGRLIDQWPLKRHFRLPECPRIRTMLAVKF